VIQGLIRLISLADVEGEGFHIHHAISARLHKKKFGAGRTGTTSLCDMASRACAPIQARQEDASDTRMAVNSLQIERMPFPTVNRTPRRIVLAKVGCRLAEGLTSKQLIPGSIPVARPQVLLPPGLRILFPVTRKPVQTKQHHSELGRASEHLQVICGGWQYLTGFALDDPSV
jgi:hypothetical protein